MSGSHVVPPLTSLTGAILADGTVELSATWDAGAFEIRAMTFQSDVATGTAPFTIASTTVVANLNADQVDGKDSTDLMLVDGTQAMTAEIDLGIYPILVEELAATKKPTHPSSCRPLSSRLC